MKKEMLINVLQPEECRIAIVEDGVLEELYVERTSLESYTGNIYKGKIVNLEPAIQAAFVDFSVGRNGFLHVSDVEPQYYLRHVAHEAEFGARDKDRDPRRDRDRRPDRDPRRERPAVEGRERPVEDREGDLPPPPPRGEERYRDRPDRSERGRRDRSVEPRRFGEGLTDDEYPPSPPPLPPAPPRSHVPAPEPPRPEPERFPREEPRRAPKAEPTPSFWGDEPRVVEREGPPAEFEEPRARLPRTAEPFDFETQLPPSRTQRARTQPPRPADLESVDVDRPAATPEPGLPESEPEPPAARERGRGRGREREPRRGRRGSRPLPEPEVMFPEEPAAGLSAEIEAPLVEPEIEALAEPPEEFRPEARPRGRAAIRSRGGEREIEPARPRALPPERPVVEPEIERDRDRPRDRPRGFEPEAPRDRPRGFEPEAPRDRPRGIEPEAPRDRDRPRGFEPEPPRERDREREPKPERTKPHDRAGEPGYVPRRERSRGSEPGFGAGIEGAGALGGSDLTGELKAEGELEAGIEPGGEEGTSAAGRLDGPRRRRRRRGRRRERGDREPLEAGAAAELEGEGEEFEEGEEEGTEIEAPVERAPARPRDRQRPPRREEIVEVEDEEHDDLGDEFDFGDEGAAIAEEEEEGIEERAAVSVDEEIDPELEEEIRREIEEIAELEREMGLRGPVEARPRRGDEREPEAGGRPGGRLPRGRGMTKPPIQEIFRRGDEVLIQVIKESIGTKGPTLSTYISIPGRYLVLMPGLNRVGVSRKIADEGQRRKLREIMTDLNPPKGLGFIVRTAGLERTKRELARDLAYLLRLWKVILRRIKKTRAPAPIYQESDMITRTIRDIFTSEIDTIWIDEPQAFERAQEFLRVVMPRFVDRLKLYSEKVPLFHKYGIEDEIAKIQRRHVPLPEGGSIVIDQTEALVAIDVNSGNFRVENDAEKTAYEMNLRAAKEIARQLRLRDLGGVIVNDFIDMREERHRRGVERALRDAIKRDRARTKILRMSAFGLIEMTRQRIRPSLKRSVYEDCAHCAGAGVLKTVESMSIDVVRLLALASHRTDIRRVNISVAPSVAAYLNNRKRHDITRIEAEANMSIFIKAEEDAAGEHLQIDCFDGSNNEIRLLPAPVATNRRGHTRD